MMQKVNVTANCEVQIHFDIHLGVDRCRNNSLNFCTLTEHNCFSHKEK